jgi:GxxExxY protein
MSADDGAAKFEEALTRSVIGVFYDVYNSLGYGFREHIYVLAMHRDLVAKGHRVEREAPIQVYHRGEPLATQVLDVIVDEKLVLEIKASEHLHPNATAQLFSYLCATNLELGLVLHFGREPKIHRVLFENRLKRYRPRSASNTTSSP